MTQRDAHRFTMTAYISADGVVGTLYTQSSRPKKGGVE